MKKIIFSLTLILITFSNTFANEQVKTYNYYGMNIKAPSFQDFYFTSTERLSYERKFMKPVFDMSKSPMSLIDVLYKANGSNISITVNDLRSRSDAMKITHPKMKSLAFELFENTNLSDSQNFVTQIVYTSLNYLDTKEGKKHFEGMKRRALNKLKKSYDNETINDIEYEFSKANKINDYNNFCVFRHFDQSMCYLNGLLFRITYVSEDLNQTNLQKLNLTKKYTNSFIKLNTK